MNENLKKTFWIGAAALVVALVVPLSALSATRSTATSFAFGRIGGNIEPFTVTIAADGSVSANGPAQSRKDKVAAADLARVTRAVVAQRFFSLPRSTSCPQALPDFASRFVTVHMHGASRRVLVHGDCSRRFSAVYAALARAVGIG
jgi:hypothetical protein